MRRVAADGEDATPVLMRDEQEQPNDADDLWPPKPEEALVEALFSLAICGVVIAATIAWYMHAERHDDDGARDADQRQHIEAIDGVREAEER